MPRKLVLIAVLTAAAALPQALPPDAQALLDRARTATAQRYEFAFNAGAKAIATSDGKSFYLLWMPPQATTDTPLVVTLHGTQGWAFDEMFLWKTQLERAGYGLLALQWYFPAADTYYSVDDLHRQLRTALKSNRALAGNNILHGFSRGSANIYTQAVLDRFNGDRFYSLIIANSGGAAPDFPPNIAITNGTYGTAPFSGPQWVLFCGGLDPNPERDGCPALTRTRDWLLRYGGAVPLFIQDPNLGHGGFQQNPAYMEQALDLFRGILGRKLTSAGNSPTTAPGAILSISGADLSPNGPFVNPGFPVALEAEGVRVRIAGRAAPIFSASPEQVNVQVPYETPLGKTSIQVGTAELALTVSATAPEIYRQTGDFALPEAAASGSVQIAYLTGQGAIVPAVATGQAAPDTPLSYVAAPVRATLGGRECEILFAGMAPRLAGLMQLNFRIPALEPGDYPFVVTIGGAASAPALVRVTGLLDGVGRALDRTGADFTVASRRSQRWISHP